MAIPITDFKELAPTANYQDSYSEVPIKIRFLVEGAPNQASKVATLKKFYPDVKELEDNNFLVTDAKGNTHIFDNREKTTLGDFVDASKEVVEMLSSTAGAVVGTGAGPAGTIIGSGAGLAAGSEIYERVAQMFGTEILRTPEEYAKQRAVDFAFGSVGQAVAPVIFKGAKYAITGGAKKVAEAGKRLESFVNAGVQPSLGQVTMNRGVQTIELGLGTVPGSSGVIAKFASQAQDDFGKTVSKMSQKILAEDGINIAGLAKGAIPDETIVGKVIQKAISDKSVLNPVNSADSWTGRFKSLSGLLFDKVDDFVGTNSMFGVSNTMNQLQKLTATIPGAENVGKSFKNPFIEEIFEGITKDATKNMTSSGIPQLPYQALKALKQRVGNRLLDADLIGTQEKGMLKQLYSALSSDIESGVFRYGGLEGSKALTKANRVYAAGLEKLEDFLQPLYNKTNPDLIVRELLASATEGATRLNALKSSLKPTQYKVLVSSVLDRMGRIAPGQGLAEGVEQTGRFSTESFLTNWNKMSPAAKKALFSGKGFGPQMAKDLDDLVKVSSIIRESGKTFKNPSGTADRIAGIGIGIGGAAGLVTGNPAFFAALPVVMLGSNMAAKLMVNPRFVSWAAQATKIAGNKGIEGIAEHMTKLGMIAANSSPEERQAIFEFLGMLEEASIKDVGYGRTTVDTRGTTPPPKEPKAQVDTEVTEQITQSVPQSNLPMFPTASTAPVAPMTPTPTTAQGQGLASLGQNYQSLFPQDVLGGAIAQRRGMV